MKQRIQVIVNGHSTHVDAEETDSIGLLSEAAVLKTNYQHIPSDKWRLVDGDGNPITAKTVGEGPPLIYLTLPAGIGA